MQGKTLNIPVPLPTNKGGTGSINAANSAGGVVVPVGAPNTANGAVILTGAGIIPALDGSLLTNLSVANASVAQAKLKTSIGEVSISTINVFDKVILPGGEYGFYPQIKCNATGNGEWAAVIVGSGSALAGLHAGWTSYTTYIAMQCSNTQTIYAQQRYVTASGKDHWIFLLIDKFTKKIIASYQAPDHPCANQGLATEQDIPHPFGYRDLNFYEIVLVDNAILDLVKSKVTYQKSLLTVINEKFIIDDSKAPKYEAREIIKIKYLPEGLTLEKRIVDELDKDIMFKTMVEK